MQLEEKLTLLLDLGFTNDSVNYFRPVSYENIVDPTEKCPRSKKKKRKRQPSDVSSLFLFVFAVMTCECDRCDRRGLSAVFVRMKPCGSKDPKAQHQPSLRFAF